MNRTIRANITGMHCASCASVIENTLKKNSGVEKISVNFGTEQALISFNPSRTSLNDLNQQIEKLGYALQEESDLSAENSRPLPAAPHSRKREKIAELAALRKKIFAALPLAAISIIVMAWEIMIGFGRLPEMPEVWMRLFHYLMPAMATYVLFSVGQPYLAGLYRFLRRGRANMDTLIGLGTLVAFIYSFSVAAFADILRPFIDVEASYFDVTIVVITFITVGKYLEMRSKMRTGDAVEKLLGLQAKTALVLRDDREQEIPLAEVVPGDIIVVKPAGRIPVDGEIVTGSSHIDEALVTGESLPVRKGPGDAVIAGTINTTGAFTFRAQKVGSETMLARIIKLVEEAQGSKAPIQALADRISAVFVPVVLALSFLTLIAWVVIGAPALGFSGAFSFGLVSFVGMLVIACPCALGLATPTAIIVGVGKGAQEGILVKDAASLEKLHRVKVLVADKTGTITKGQPELIGFRNFSQHTDDQLLAILASLEKRSEHPIALALTKAAEEKSLRLPESEDFEIIKGRGLRARIEDRQYHAGNSQLINSLNLPFDQSIIEEETSRGRTPVILAADNEVLALALVADAIKPGAAEAVKKLRHLGVRVIMLTGDHRNTARHIAVQAGIEEIVAEVMPEEKLNKIKELQAEGLVIAMAGDGVNDAPALAQADIGIAMATGTDVAIESASITLLHGDIAKITKAIRLSRLTMRGIRQNLFWAFIYNIVGIPLAAGLFYPFFGWLLSPVFAGFAMAASSVSVIANSLRLKTMKL